MGKFITEVIGNEYKEWNDGKIVINTPCASGKTTFIFDVLLPHYYGRGKKMLMICNRRALKEQYSRKKYEVCQNYEEAKAIEFDTYQNMGASCYAKNQLPEKYYRYDIFCFDEVHCLAEEDYNKTYYNLFQVICSTLQQKTLIFMSATLGRMKKYLKQYKDLFGFGVRYGDWSCEIPRHLPSWSLFFLYDNIPVDYSYIEMIGIRDERQLCTCIYEDVMSSNGQVLVFSETRSQISALKNKLIDEEGLKKGQIMEVNSTRMNDGSLQNEKDEMLNGEHFPEGVDVILTTKVLDNGITLRSDGTFSICALVTNKIEFIQMISRLRVIPGQKVKLYVMEVDGKMFADKVRQGERAIEFANKITKQGISAKDLDMAQADEVLRKLLFIDSRYREREVLISRGDQGQMYSSMTGSTHASYKVNPFVVDKFQEETFALKKMQSGVYNNPRILAEVQAQWLGLDKDAIKWLELNPIKDRIKEIVSHEIQGVSYKELGKVINDVATLCWNDVDLKKNVERKGASMSIKKFKNLCETLQLNLCDETVIRDGYRRKSYTVVEIQN